MGIGFIDGATEADFYVKGGGSQAIALGVMTYIADLGDAPATYGSPSHIPQFTWQGGEVARGTSANIFSSSFQLAQPVQPLIRLGATVDVETIDAYSATAMNDDQRGISDEDALPGPVRTPLLAVGDTYTLENVLCTATPTAAPVYGFIDFNRDGDFLDEGERSALAMCSGMDSSVNLSWTVPSGTLGGDSYLRLRTAADASQISSPTGVAVQGEVEDYPIYILTSQITLVKEVVGRVYGDDQFTVEVVHDGNILSQATTTGSGGGTNATIATPTVAAPQDSSVILRESLSGTGSLGDYSREMSCVAGPENRTVIGQTTYDSATGTWSLPITQGNDVVCTLVNTGQPKIAVSKTTVGGFGGPFTISATNLDGQFDPVSTTSVGTAQAATPALLAPANLSLPVTFSEIAAPRYDLTSASCTDEHSAGTGNVGVVGQLVDGTVVVPPAALRPGARIVCNFINTKQASLTLNKTLPKGRYEDDDQFSLAIATAGEVVSTSTTTGTDTTANGAASVATAVLGQAYRLSEALIGSTDPSRYTATWSCQNQSQVAGAQAPTGTGEAFEIPPAAGDELTCTLSNTRANKADLSITKSNAGDHLLPNTRTTYTLTVTNHGPDPVSGAVVRDPAPADPLSCPAVEVVLCTGDGCPATTLSLSVLQSANGLSLGTIAANENVTLTYGCDVR